MKKILSFLLAIVLMMGSMIALKPIEAQAVSLVKYEMQAINVLINENQTFFSLRNDLSKDSTILYETEDGEKHSFKTIQSEKGRGYYFEFKVAKAGLWKLVEINGEKVTSDERNFVVFETQKELEAADKKLAEEAIKKAKALSEAQEKRIKDGEMNVLRLEGKDRYITAVEASKYSFPKGNETVVIATGENFVDGLVGGSLTSQIDAPLLLVRKDSIAKEVIEEIKRLEAKKIIILGGEMAVSTKVEKEILKLKVKVERLAGKNRVETAEKIAEKRGLLLPKMPVNPNIALVSGTNFADALSAGPYIGELAKYSVMNYKLIPFVKGASYKEVNLVFGGQNAVPLKNAIVEERIEGENRYETSKHTARSLINRLQKEVDTLVLVNGLNFPDGLSSASVASTNNGVVMLTNPESLSIETYDYILEHGKFKNVIIVGGENAVSKDIENFLKGK